MLPRRALALCALPLALFLASVFLAPSAAMACGVGTDCRIGERAYRIAMPPDTADGAPGAILFIHGYRGSAEGVMRNRSLVAAVNALGLALVAPDGRDGSWALPNHPGGRTPDEMPYFDALREQLIAKHGIDPTRIMVSGFSAGGMVTWELACNRGGDYLGFVPVAGTFWAPVPSSCPALPASVIHIHGRSDVTVPLEGRPIGSTRQGSVLEAVDMYARHGGFGQPEAVAWDGLDCTQRRNPGGDILDFCLHDGGHSFRSDYITRAWRRLDAR